MKLKIIALVCAMALPWRAFAAVFSITNNSGAPISQKPSWSGDNEKFVSLTPGQSASYNSGFNNLDTITWEQRLETTDDQKKNGIICLKRFVANLNIVWSALGGSISIMSDGNYAYNFSTMAGSGSGRGQPAAL
jgi:hypothetical protein